LATAINYLIWSDSKYFFGCASLLTQCHWEAACTYHYFQKNDLMHKSILVYPNSQYHLDIHQDCYDKCHVKIPHIMQAYLSIGAKICSLPAIDQQFKTIDFLTISNLQEFTRYHYFMR
jgi:putative hemolysin